MAFTLGDKTSRVIRFLLGLRNPRIATALSGYGFKQADLAEGWALVNALGSGRLAVLPTEPRDMEALQKLDAWENQWFPITLAVLERRFPATAAKFFLNLQQTEGPGVAVSVRVFIDRLDELATGGDKFGAEGKKAFEILVTRGLTAGVVQEAKSLLNSLAEVAAPGAAASIEEQDAELQKAEDALWAWYKEWSRIARIAVKQRVLLKQLGFLSGTKTADDEEDLVTPAPTPATPTAPVATTPARPPSPIASA